MIWKRVKYSEKFFKFPIRVYDEFSLVKAMVKEDRNFSEAKDPDEIDGPEKGDWVMGFARVPYKEILGWVDHFEEGTNVKDVHEKGFDMTMVLTRTMGRFECIWKREKFESKLNEFVEKNRII